MEYKENENVIVRKSFEFAVKIVKRAMELKRNSHNYELASQVLRSGASVGANIAEAQSGQSKRDFISKMQIALKEANETEYWLRLLMATEVIPKEVAQPLIADVKELIRILVAILKNSKAN